MCGLFQKAFEWKSHLDCHIKIHTGLTSPAINEGDGPSRVSGPMVETHITPTLQTINEGAGPSRMSL